MMFKVSKDGNQVILETKAGQFVLTKSLDDDYPGFYVDYQEPGAPLRTLAVVEHFLEQDALQLWAWEHANSGTADVTHKIIFDRPQREDLTKLKTVLDHVTGTHAGCELAFIKKDTPESSAGYLFEIGYFDRQDNFWPLQELTIKAVLNDIKYCVESYDVEWREE